MYIVVTEWKPEKGRRCIAVPMTPLTSLPPPPTIPNIKTRVFRYVCDMPKKKQLIGLHNIMHVLLI